SLPVTSWSLSSKTTGLFECSSRGTRQSPHCGGRRARLHGHFRGGRCGRLSERNRPSWGDPRSD
ncbi:MAG: hypothetical protein AVDCRST_MAG88-3513, partial [uncultured Thermomicrobiales bacterium]